MTSVKLVTLQSLEDKLGVELAIRSCAPVAFYMLLKANGYLPQTLEPDTFCFELKRTELGTENANWSRPALTRELRAKYSAEIVSWQLSGSHDIQKMTESGYLSSNREVEFFHNHIQDRDISNIVRDGYPVIVTMRPGFGTPDNHSIHAVIIAGWKHGKVTIVDPDARNSGHIFDERRVRQYISPKGGGTVILPRR